MNQKEIESVLRLSASKRYEYFIKKVVDLEEVWGLYNNGWAVTQDDEGNGLIPFWPKNEFAQTCAVEEWESYHPKKIELQDFINDWLPGMKEDGYKPSIFWNNIDSARLEIETVLADLNLELQNY